MTLSTLNKSISPAIIISSLIFNYCNADASVKTSPEYLKEKEMHHLNPGKFSYIMFGDSITKGGKWNKLLPGYSVGNRGISGDDTSGMLERFEDVEKTGAKTVFIMAGTNDVSRKVRPEIVVGNITAMTNKMRKDGINVVIQSTILSGKERESKNKSINIINSSLKEYSVKSGVPFLDLNKNLSENGLLKREYTYDGTHLTDRGYDVWSKILLNFLKKSNMG
ncbi:GDSL-type esterase/lipase family protein [Serratia sp. Nf2]|uniref:GDSL-type esterase/lipase family protein n=1 Tax=Serratia sp. Nf2 TaxID=2116540 RepID=UPI000D17CCD5|nr:GDSL-type esterase/lipase family protein [Serratia sp. Nf2]PTA77182.1 hypothetical protein C9411_13535 [Serratia sp. Nf2]